MKSGAPALAVALTINVAAFQSRTVWDAVYSDAQAKRGLVSYTKSCAQCHAEDLKGSGNGPALAGEDFLAVWRGRNVGELLEQMQNLMPPDRPGSLPAAVYRDLAAFILKSNDFPAGQNELDTAIAELRRIMITARARAPKS